MDKKIYKMDEKIAFRKCSLYDGKQEVHGDCTNFSEIEEKWKSYFVCNQYGIHFHCGKHPEIELQAEENEYFGVSYSCPQCNEIVTTVKKEKDLLSQCLAALNREEFKDAKLIRLDDWYTPEVRERSGDSEYWVQADVKTDKDGDTIIVLYVGHKGDREKAQFFIKPEKRQLTSDHKDMDPAKVLSKIEVTLKNRKMIQEYDGGEET